jgi:signal transduction histidine kinase
MTTSIDHPHLAYRDRLLEPFLVAAYIAVIVAELIGSHAPAVVLGWFLFVPVALLALWTLIPAKPEPFPVRFGLLVLDAVIAGVLFGVPAGTFSAGFVFIAALAAGRLLESRRAALTVAIIASVSCAGSSLVASQYLPPQWPWWLGLAAGLPVYVGISRRDRLAALLEARVGAAEAERARAAESRESALIERGRIAREIHDVLGHSLSAISLQLDVADTLQSRGRADESVAALRRARALARTGIGETRRAVHALQEDPLPLTDSIAGIAAAYGASFAVSGTPEPVGIEIAQTLIRAAQEALTNAHRHAPGAVLTVALDFRGAVDFGGADAGTSDVELTVTNGPATSPARHADEQTEGTGMGLDGMRERARLRGGVVEAGPDPTNAFGWTVSMRLPR